MSVPDTELDMPEPKGGCLFCGSKDNLEFIDFDQVACNDCVPDTTKLEPLNF